MKRKMKTGRAGCAFVLCLLAAVVLTGCGSSEKYTEPLTIDVYDETANRPGLQTGWFAKIIKDKFNMELNIITPNAAGSKDLIYETRAAAGDVGDIIIVNTTGGRLADLIDAGLVTDMDPFLRGRDILKNYPEAAEAMREFTGTDELYAFPGMVSKRSATTVSGTVEPSYGTYVRWDYYKKLGYPEMKTFDDLLTVMADMQEMARAEEGRDDIYAFSFFADWDGAMMNNAKQPACLYGYDEMGFALAKGDTGETESILAPDGLYIKALRFFNEAERRGLVDPESRSQNFDTLSEKYRAGRILFSFWPWLSVSLYNTKENTEAGKGYMFAPVDDLKILAHGCYPEGYMNGVICIGSGTEDPQRMADFIDWLYSPEGVEINEQANGTAGPEDLTWEKDADGSPRLTDFGIAALSFGDTEVPDAWGGGSWEDGISCLNFQAVDPRDTDPGTGESYDYRVWKSEAEREAGDALLADWQNFTGAENTMDYLVKHDMLTIAPGSIYSMPPEDAETDAVRNELKKVIVSRSWDMVYASSGEDFDTMRDNMILSAQNLGYSRILAIDLQNARDQQAARAASAAKYQ